MGFQGQPKRGCPFPLEALFLPIHKEGYPFIALFAAVNLLAFLFSAWLG